MTLALCYVAHCDGCQRDLVLHTRELREAKSVIRQAGWRSVVQDAGLELLCSTCMEALDQSTQARIIAKRGGELLPYRLERPRVRPGLFPCSVDGDMYTLDQMAYLPWSKVHPLNLACLACCLDKAARRGYDARTPEMIEEERRRATGDPLQQSLF